MRLRVPAIGVALLLSSAGCLDTGQERATIPLRVAGTLPEEPVAGVNGWSIELSRADLAFGPLYLCAGSRAGALCETARLEWVDSAVVNVLAAEDREVGALHGVTGTVRSWMYDLGITSLLTQQRPVSLSASEELAGNSVILEGVARKEQLAIPFLFEIPIQQETEIGVSVVRKSGSDRFDHEVTGEEPALTLRFDARPWVRDIDFESIVESGELRFAPDSQGYRALENAIVAGEPPAFEWSDTP